MTTDEKRKKLQNYCNKLDYCDECKIDKRYPDHECGNRLCFVDSNGNKLDEVPDSCVETYYNFLFVEEHDNVEHPIHYETGKFECIEVMQEVMGVEAVKDFCVCNAFKYIYRHKKKNGKEDLEKAKWYINKYLELSKESEK